MATELFDEATWPVTPETNIGDATFEIDLALDRLLTAALPVRVRFHDSPDFLPTWPGHSIFIPADGVTPVRDYAARILPALLREVLRQLDEHALPVHAPGWTVFLDSRGFALMGDGEFVREGMRFDATVQVVVAS